MNCAEFIDIVKSGQPVLFRRHSKEYIRLAERSLAIVAEDEKHYVLWIVAERKFQSILRGTVPTERYRKVLRETVSFLNRWQEMADARDWSRRNFPSLTEIATFIYMTLIPEYWMIYLEIERKPAEEALPVVAHEKMYMEVTGYDG